MPPPITLKPVILSEAEESQYLARAIHIAPQSHRMPDHHYFVYILSSTHKHLYTGVTNNLERRIAQHKSKSNPNSFTAKYNIHQLVHFEHYTDICQAIARETEVKKWNRLKKIALITAMNPTWRDLSRDFGKRIDTFNQKDQKPPTTF